MSLYLDISEGLQRLRHALKKNDAWKDGIRLVMPLDAIRSIQLSMPPERLYAQDTTGRTKLQGIELVAQEERSPRELQLLAEIDSLRRELHHSLATSREMACVQAMADIMNAVPIKDAVEAGQTIRTLTDYVVRRLRDV